MADWNSTQYLKFENERTQPAIDLARRIPCEAPGKILDIGCGPGNSSQVLARRFPDASIMGVDSPAAMIETAKANYPTLDFRICDAGKDLSLLGNNFDVIFSNACIQWIPDHARLLKNMLRLLRPGGVLAVQTPMNYKEPIHTIIQEVSTSDVWRKKFDSPRIFHNLTPERYFDLLSEIASDFCLWETTYYHVLKSHKDIMEWYRGTGLRPYLNALSDEDAREFEQAVFERVVKQYPKQQNDEIIFRFPRFFFTATA
jgi:trans-aconitate 2-methyltransferase